MSKGRNAAAGELEELGAALALAMARHNGRSAMVRTFVNETGGVVLSANLYATGGEHGRYDPGMPVVQMRKELK